ncbi:MAG: hypothetical protein H7123_00195, partial [Thermoleophilia bacterium]|nr:hypothetical protein [Thermoleophilia bacterium]
MLTAPPAAHAAVSVLVPNADTSSTGVGGGSWGRRMSATCVASAATLYTAMDEDLTAGSLDTTCAIGSANEDYIRANLPSIGDSANVRMQLSDLPAGAGLTT